MSALKNDSIRRWTLAAGIFGVYVFYVLFMLIEGELSWWTVLDSAALIVFVVCLIGLWKHKLWARYLSLYLRRKSNYYPNKTLFMEERG